MSSDLLQQNRDSPRALLRKVGVDPKRAAGQNFLVDSNVVDDLVAAAGLERGDRVLEIGPGLGVVTEALIDAGASVTAVELDRRLAEYLRVRFDGEQRLTVIQSDILRLRLSDIFRDGRYKLVASLPYGITSLVLRNFLELPPRPTVLSLLIQREVAERVVALPGSMSMLSVSCQYLGDPTIVRTVAKESFFPQPEVEGAIVRIAVRPLPSEDERSRLFRLCRIGFSSRRKMLHNNLDAGLRLERGLSKEILMNTGLPEACRAQDLTVQDWQKLSRKLL